MKSIKENARSSALKIAIPVCLASIFLFALLAPLFGNDTVCSSLSPEGSNFSCSRLASYFSGVALIMLGMIFVSPLVFIVCAVIIYSIIVHSAPNSKTVSFFEKILSKGAFLTGFFAICLIILYVTAYDFVKNERAEFGRNEDTLLQPERSRAYRAQMERERAARLQQKQLDSQAE